MPDSKYQLRYLPKYEDDLNEIIDYIVLELKNPVSANSLVDKIELAIFERLHFPLSFEPYQSVKKRKHPYYPHSAPQSKNRIFSQGDVKCYH